MNFEEKALKLIPGGASTRTKFFKNMPDFYPKICNNAYDYKINIDDKYYIDLSSGLGSCILGYDYLFGKEYYNCLDENLSLTHKSEIELAEKLNQLIPCAEQVRFFKTGSEATSAAIRLARYVTSRQKIITIGYNGWHDWYASCLDPPLCYGTKYQNVIKMPCGNLDYIRQYIDYETAAVIIEPFNREIVKHDIQFLKELKQVCKDYNALFILDEIFSGFRFAFPGLQLEDNIIPDLSCFSKAMGNGAPIAALVGKRKYMSKITDLHISGTYCGETYGLNKALYTINELEKENTIIRLNSMCAWFNGEVLRMIDYLDYDFVSYECFRSWGRFVWKDRKKELKFLKHLIDNGVFYHKNSILNYSHTEEILNKVISIYFEGLKKLV